MPKQFGPTSRMPCRERDLGRARRAGEFAARHAGQLTVEPGEQRRVIRAGLTADPARLALGVERAEAEQAQVRVLRRQRGVHLPHRDLILRRGQADLDGTAVCKQSEHRGGHAISRGMSPVPAGWPAGITRAY